MLILIEKSVFILYTEFERCLCIKSLVKNTTCIDIGCQWSARSADLHAFDSNKTMHFIIRNVKKILFHRLLKILLIYGFFSRKKLSTANMVEK